MLAIMAEDTLLAPIFNTRYCLASESPPTLAPSSIGGIVAAMKHVLLALLALVVAAGCGKKEVGPGEKKVSETIGTTPIKPVTVLWEFKTGGLAESSPAIGSDGTVYVGSGYGNNKLYAINPKSGIKLWEFKTGDAIVYSSPAIGSDGTVYVGSMDEKLYAINGKSGVKLWEFEMGDPLGYVESSPAIGPDGTVYVGSYDNKLYAIKTDSKGLAKSPWPMRGQNAQHTGHAPAK